MIKIHAEYIVDEKSQKKAVVIPINEWKKIMEEIEELEDIRDYDRAKRTEDEEISLDLAIKEIESGKIQVNFDIKIKRSAQKSLARIEAGQRKRIIEAIQRLSFNPRPSGCKSFQGGGYGEFGLGITALYMKFMVMN